MEAKTRNKMLINNSFLPNA